MHPIYSQRARHHAERHFIFGFKKKTKCNSLNYFWNGRSRQKTGTLVVNELVRKGKLTVSTWKGVKEGDVELELMRKRHKTNVVGSKVIFTYDLQEFNMNIKLNKQDEKKLVVKKIEEKVLKKSIFSGKSFATMSSTIVVLTGAEFLSKLAGMSSTFFSQMLEILTRKQQEKKEVKGEFLEEEQHLTKKETLEGKLDYAFETMDVIADYLKHEGKNAKKTRKHRHAKKEEEKKEDEKKEEEKKEPGNAEIEKKEEETKEPRNAEMEKKEEESKEAENAEGSGSDEGNGSDGFDWPDWF